MIRLQWPFSDAVLLLTSRFGEMSIGAIIALTLFCLVVPIAIISLYRYEMRLVKPAIAAGLLALRLITALTLLAILMFQPVLERTTSQEVSARVLVAIDRSNSMKVADPQRTPLEKLRLARALKLVPEIPELEDWINQYESKQTVEWVKPDEFANNPAGRQRAEAERRKQHDQVCQIVDQVTRAGVVQRVLAVDGPDLLGALARKHNVEILGFSQEAWDVMPDQLSGLLDPFTRVRPAGEVVKDRDRARDDGTDITLPLIRALERSGEADNQILGVVLFTDGRHNARSAKSPVEIADRLRPESPKSGEGEAGKSRHIPVYPIALGARKAPPDIAVASVETNPRTVFKEMDVVIDARVKVSGLPKQEITLELVRPGKEPMRERIQHDGSDRYYDVRFSVKMDQIGAHVYQVVAKSIPGEVRTDNNSQPVYINVADDKAKVLVVDGEARWEFHYLWSALQRDPQMKPQSILFTQPRLGRIAEDELEKLNHPKLAWPTDPDGLAGYDCIVLGNVSPKQLPAAERVRLEKYVSDRGGTLVILAGKDGMPLAFRDAPALPRPEDPSRKRTGKKEETDPILKLLPIEEPRVARPAQGFPLTFTHQGRLTRFLEMDSAPEVNAKIWTQLPKHYWGVIGKAKPGAQVLAYVAGADGAAPAGADAADTEPGRNQALVVRQNYGFGRVLYVGIDSTWRWRYRKGDTYHHRFWSQVIHWAAADKPLVAGNDHVRFGTRDPVYRQGSEIDLVARLADAEKPLPPEALAGARILKLPEDGGKGAETSEALVPLKRKEGQPRILDGKVPPYLAPGKYAIELAIPELAGKLDAPPGADGKVAPLRASFSVLPGTSEEALELGTNWALLEEIAAKSGGKVFTPENASEVVELLAKRTGTIERHPQNKTWEDWRTLVLVLALLTVEWVARKLVGLP